MDAATKAWSPKYRRPHRFRASATTKPRKKTMRAPPAGLQQDAGSEGETITGLSSLALGVDEHGE